MTDISKEIKKLTKQLKKLEVANRRKKVQKKIKTRQKRKAKIRKKADDNYLKKLLAIEDRRERQKDIREAIERDKLLTKLEEQKRKEPKIVEREKEIIREVEPFNVNKMLDGLTKNELENLLPNLTGRSLKNMGLRANASKKTLTMVANDLIMDNERLTDDLKGMDISSGVNMLERISRGDIGEEEQKGDGHYEEEKRRKISILENQIEKTNNQIRDLEEKRMEITSLSNAKMLLPTPKGKATKIDARIMYREYTSQIEAKEDILKKLKKDLDTLKNTTQYGTFSFTKQEEEQKGEGQRGGALDGGLYESQINERMKSCPIFKKTIARNEIGTIEPSKILGIIMNTQPRSSEGKHWVAVYIDTVKDKSVEYYDPLGDPPDKNFDTDIMQIINKLKPKNMLKYKINSVANQDASDNCGEHCMKFINDRYSGKSFTDTTGYKEIKNQQNVSKKEADLAKFGYI